MLINKVSLKEIYFIKNCNELVLHHCELEEINMTYLRILCPTNKSFFGLNIYPNLMKYFMDWSMKSFTSFQKKLEGMYRYNGIEKFIPTSFFPKWQFNEINMYIETIHFNWICKHFDSQINQFKDDSFICKQWMLSNTDNLNDLNYIDFISIINSEAADNKLMLCLMALLKNKEHPIKSNCSIRYQLATSFQLFSLDSNFQININKFDALSMAIVNYLKWPYLYSIVSSANDEIINSEFLHYKFTKEKINIDYRSEIKDYLNYFDEKYPVVNSSLN